MQSQSQRITSAPEFTTKHPADHPYTKTLKELIEVKTTRFLDLVKRKKLESRHYDEIYEFIEFFCKTKDFHKSKRCYIMIGKFLEHFCKVSSRMKPLIDKLLAIPQKFQPNDDQFLDVTAHFLELHYKICKN